MSVMSENIKKLRNKRGQVKATVTRIEGFVNDPISFTSATVDTLEARKEKLISSLKEYEEIQLDILNGDETDNEDVGAFEDRFFNALAKLNEGIRTLKGTETAQGNNISTSKLPCVDMPTFSGKDFTQFKPFYDMFIAVIDNNKALSHVQKLFYLRKYLSDEALSIIVNLPLVNASYPEALELLTKRYDNRSRLIMTHINVLLDIPCMNKGTAASIRSFVSQVQQQLHALKNLNEPVDKWDMLVISILSRKLDQYTSRAFHLERDPQTLPTMTEFITFLERRAMALEDSLPQKSTTMENGGPSKYKSYPKVTNVVTASEPVCKFCIKSGHAIYNCAKFQEASVEARLAFVQEQKMCSICINTHAQKPCKYKFKCKICRGSHNTLLHAEDSVNDNPPIVASTALSCVNDTTYKVLLPTIKVKILDKFGHYVYCRALCDSGSSASFATNSLVNRLGFSTVNQKQNIIGITNKATQISKSVSIPIESCQYQDVKFNVDCHVVETITTHLPQQYFDCSKLNIPSHVRLSDYDFNVPSEISMLLGADIYFNALLNDCIRLPGGPVLQSTLFGYVVAGRITHAGDVSNTALVSNFAICDNVKLENVMNEFWLAEKVPETKQKDSLEFERAEKIFQESVCLKENKFQVDIPLKRPLNELNLGDSFSAALQRLFSLERKFKKNVELLEQYKKFIDEYLELGHAKEVDINSYDLLKGPVSFLAHFFVYNPASKTTKLRVVMDGSMKSKNKLSVNDVVLNGPVVQGELFDILIMFRTYLFTLICDVEKMFRCILVNPDHRCLQNILWRDNPMQPIRCLQLQRITFGLKSSSYLATRCLVELVNLFGENYPLASQAILNNTYVDDVIAGADSVEDLYQLKNELIELFQLGSFKLHKWCSNYTPVLDSLPENSKYFEQVNLDSSNIIKTLGLKYDITTDTLTFECPFYNEDSLYTKRTVLSFVGKCYDPLGLIAPIIVSAKIFMQGLWKSTHLGWDTMLPSDQLEIWRKFLSNLKLMGTITLPRLVCGRDYESVELVGYADASFKAFGCCVYVRAFRSDGTVESKLLCAKSKVAPLSKCLTIPMLELNSALLLAQLVSRVSEKLRPRFAHTTFLYSDSQIVLCWIKSEKTKVNTCVNNRVKKILELTHRDQWSYVKSCDNPADLVSRGVEPQSLQNKNIWWCGPDSLCDSSYRHPKFDTTTLSQTLVNDFYNADEDVPCNFNQPEQSLMTNLFEKYSSLNKLQNVVAYMYRFYNNISKLGNQHDSTILTPKELIKALFVIIRCVQRQHFGKEIDMLLSGKVIKSGIADLHPFVDSLGILRVGGRLQNADISQDRKHPPILPKKSHFTTLLIEREHLRLLHVGARAVLSSLAQKYWIINGIREVKKVVNKCITCARLKAEAARQLMGSLPAERITASRAFQHVGIDFCGPFSTKVARIRKPLITKSYIALFVCFATKAIHVELVSNLKTETFLASLDRFISRRGIPTAIYCDNAKTFKGAANQLKELYDLQCSKEHRDSVYRYSTKKYISFKFIPSYAPQFGGLWEAGVKSVKYHLKRVVGNHCLTFEELYTVIVQIEGVLNSRPLLSLDPKEGKYLSPSSFLVGTAITSYPDVDLTEIPVIRLRKFWDVVTKLKQDFWKSWSNDYLCQLQSRPKWKHNSPNLNVGDLVLVKNLNTAPLCWPMARIVKIFPGKDSRVRVAEVKIGDKLYVRPITKLCPLPLD